MCRDLRVGPDRGRDLDTTEDQDRVPHHLGDRVRHHRVVIVIDGHAPRINTVIVRVVRIIDRAHILDRALHAVADLAVAVEDPRLTTWIPPQKNLFEP